MRRKVIQIADSTQLISLPRKWCLANNVQKGDELNVIASNKEITVSCDNKAKTERCDMNFEDFGSLAARYIHGLYKYGIDEIKIILNSPEEFAQLQTIIRNETVGFEIIEQGSKYCVIKNVSGHIEGFDNLLRRTWLLLINMADDCATALDQKDMSAFGKLLMLEESNNRLTTICRRFINKYGVETYAKVGPIYYLIEDLENLADEYKYLFQQLKTISDENNQITKRHVEIYSKIAEMIRSYEEAFYKFDIKKIKDVSRIRKDLISTCYSELDNKNSKSDFLLIHHALIIIQKVFNMIGPLFILHQGQKMKDSQ